MKFLASLVTLLVWASAHADDAAPECAAPELGVCIENGVPNPGDNVDDDCCALTYSASCAVGWSYSEGEICARSERADARATCCTPCPDGETCFRGFGAYCAAPERSICMERDYPLEGPDNVDDDCCPAVGNGWCAEGYKYEKGDLCYKSGSPDAPSGEYGRLTGDGYATCCTPCNGTFSAFLCDDGPGNDPPQLDSGTIAAILGLGLITCIFGVGGLLGCVPVWHWIRGGGLRASLQKISMRVAALRSPVDVVGEYEGVNQVEMSVLPSYDEFTGGHAVTGSIVT